MACNSHDCAEKLLPRRLTICSTAVRFAADYVGLTVDCIDHRAHAGCKWGGGTRWGVAGESFHQTSLYHNTLSRFSSRRQVTDRQTLTRGQNHPKPHVYHAISHCVLVNCLCCFTSSVQNIRHKSRTDSDGDQLSSHHECTNCSAILFLACQTLHICEK